MVSGVTNRYDHMDLVTVDVKSKPASVNSLDKRNLPDSMFFTQFCSVLSSKV